MMNSLTLTDAHFDHAKSIFPTEVRKLIAEKNITVLVQLLHMKAKDWPWKSVALSNEPFEIPIAWALFRPGDNTQTEMLWDIHPMKCLPRLYARSNPNAKTHPMPIILSGQATLGGCRGRVMMAHRNYEVNVKNAEYCSIFGLPDDCYDPGFEPRMIDALKQHKGEIWCFERNAYITSKVEPNAKVRYMKGDFLPSKNFIYVDTPEHFLRGIFRLKELDPLSDARWYSTGRELIQDLDLDYEGGYRFEEQATYFIRKRMINEFIKLALLVFNKDRFAIFEVVGPPKLETGKLAEVGTKLRENVDWHKKTMELALSKTLRTFTDRINTQALARNKFMVMDVEYLHVTYPTGKEGFFNFPCIFSQVTWLGPKGLAIDVNPFVIPCHGCPGACQAFRKGLLDFRCLPSGLSFIERQVSSIERLLSSYEGFKIYTYGRSDAFQLEQSTNFFMSSFDWHLYDRRNRKKARRIVDLMLDLSVPSTELREVEKTVLEPWLTGWSRGQEKVNVNSRFMTKYDDRRWADSYVEAISSCILDAISAFLYLIHEKYRRG